jgi:hypothetical protein
MSINIIGASTLKRFTAAITESLKVLDHQGDFDLIQVHASPVSRHEDFKILEEAELTGRKKKYLVHRPDELLLYQELMRFFENHTKIEIILLGDLVLDDPFWKKRKKIIKVIPHPYFTLDFPDQMKSKITVGAFASWGEMRKLEHYLRFLETLLGLDSKQKFIGKIGGWFNGRALDEKVLQCLIEIHKFKIRLGKDLILASSSFLPHVNVQLYHLNGKKRLGESSGSLHSGISLPVIFEANGMERLEDIEVIKISADDYLNDIDFKSAAQKLLKCDVHSIIFRNFESSSKNNFNNFTCRLDKELL